MDGWVDGFVAWLFFSRVGGQRSRFVGVGFVNRVFVGGFEKVEGVRWWSFCS